MNNTIKLEKCYECDERSSKGQMLACINSFINQEPNFKPLNRKKNININIAKFCAANNIKLLDINFFAFNINYDLTDTRFGRYIFIGVDVNNIKKIYVKRNRCGQFQEIGVRLSESTLYNIYEAFVKNIVSHKLILHQWKTVPSIMNEIKVKKYFFQEKNVSIWKINNIEFNKDKSYIKISYDMHKLNNISLSIEYIRTSQVSLLTWKEFLSLFPQYNIITLEEIQDKLINYITSQYKIAENNIHNLALLINSNQ